MECDLYIQPLSVRRYYLAGKYWLRIKSWSNNYIITLLGLPTAEDPVIRKLDETRYHHVLAGDGTPHLADLWLKVSDLQEIARFNPDSQNVYHLFTRQNPTVSQPLLVGSNGLLGLTNYDARRRTIVLFHGWLDNINSDVNSVLVPAFLSAEDVNVIAVDWSAGAGTINYAAAVTNTVTSGLPTAEDPVIRKLDETRYHHVLAGDGTPHLADLWLKVSDLQEIARFNPDSQNVYHLFTRQNPTVSQPLLVGSNGLLGLTNYDARRRTIVLFHGWLDNINSDVNSVLVPAFLSAEDVNVIAVDWSAGAGTINYAAAVTNTVTSGQSVARFISWLNEATGAVPKMYHLVGHSLGAHQVGVVGRNLGGQVAYITAVDAALLGFITNDDKFRSSDGVYTEAIHTSAGLIGYIADQADVDFYPNGGRDMPGCNSQECDHMRGIFYLGESLTSGGFKGQRCISYATAMMGQCYLWGSLRMGGLVPKNGSSGIFYLQTNAAPPFSQG